MRVLIALVLMVTSAAAYSVDNPFQIRRVRLQLVTHCHRVNKANGESVHCPCYVELMLRGMASQQILDMHDRAIEALPGDLHSSVRQQCNIAPEAWDPFK